MWKSILYQFYYDVNIELARKNGNNIIFVEEFETRFLSKAVTLDFWWPVFIFAAVHLAISVICYIRSLYRRRFIKRRIYLGISETNLINWQHLCILTAFSIQIYNVQAYSSKTDNVIYTDSIFKRNPRELTAFSMQV